jgi:hypothetical protein
MKRLLIIFILLLPAFSWLLQPGYFTMHDDLQTVRQLQMDLCFRDGQIPCRWGKELGYGFGYPLFNFYPPVPYLLGQVFRTFGLAYVDIVKAVGVTGFLLTAYFMYLLGKELWGKKGGLISMFIYTYAPYHSVDFFVRGAMNEFWAMAFYPAIFLSLYRLVRTNEFRYVLLTALSVAGLMLSHNPMLLIFTPVAIAWTLFWLWRQGTLRSFPKLVMAAILAFGLAAFFTLPVLIEQRFAHVETLTIGYFNFLAHFLDLNQIFFRINWGYGESILGPADTMSFALGYLQWLLPLCVLTVFAIFPKYRKYFLEVVLLLVFVLGALFMSHSRSTPLWLKIPPIQFLQFPWRFLTLAVFSSSVIAGAAGLFFPKGSRSKLIFSLLAVFILILNANYFRPRAWFPDMTDVKKFSGDSWRWQVTGSIFDYLPIYAPLPPPDPAGGDIGITSGSGEYKTLEKTSNKQLYTLDISSDVGATVEIQTFYFPGWRVWVDGREVKIDPSRDPLLGRMQVDVSAGQHTLEARFGNTPIRTAANIISLLSWLSLPVLFYAGKRRATVKSP